MSIKHITDAAILATIDNGKVQAGRFGNIARDLGIGCGESALRRRLVKLEATDRIARCPRYSAANSIYWIIKGRLAFPLGQLDEPTREILGDRPVRIWSGEHGYFWRPGACGYTNHHEAAGVWNASEAYRMVQHCGPEKRISLVAVRP